MAKWHEMQCPKCKLDGDLQVTFTGTCRLTSDGSEDIGNHEYDDTHNCFCGDCGYEATVAEFRIKNQPVVEGDGGGDEDDEDEI